MKKIVTSLYQSGIKINNKQINLNKTLLYRCESSFKLHVYEKYLFGAQSLCIYLFILAKMGKQRYFEWLL